MEESQNLPKEEFRRQFKQQAFGQTQTPAEIHPLDEIARRTTSWKVALRDTRNLTRWLELVRTRKLYLAAEHGWVTPLQLEESLSRMACKYGVDCWLKHAGKATMELLAKGGLKNMVVYMERGIPMVQTRFKVKTKQYFGATQLPLILASTELGYLLCLDAHNATHRAGDLALSVTKQTAFVVGGKKLLLSIRRRCVICRKEALPL